MKTHIGVQRIEVYSTTWTNTECSSMGSSAYYGAVTRAMCGQRHARTADDPRHATCQRCRRLMARALNHKRED